jgi:hypothetical protein
MLVFFIANVGVSAYAQENYCDDESFLVGEYNQCIPKCGQGLEYNKTSQKCVDKRFELSIVEEHWIGIGVIVAAVATGAGIIISLLDRRKEREKRTQEIIQTYDEELRDITEQEKNLNTKLECSLYVERYLDTVEKIATLSLQKNFQGSVSDFFENNFSYAIELWRWYLKNVVHVRDEFIGVGQDLGPLWKTASEFKRDKPSKEDIWNEFKERYLKTHLKDENNYESEKDKKKIKKENEKIEKENEKIEKNFKENYSSENFKMELLRYYQNERWREFRTWCNREKLSWRKKKDTLTPFPSNFGKIQNDDEMKKQDEKNRHSDKYRILPEVLYEQYENIPEENGLTKGELVEIIRGFSKDLTKIAEMEKSLSNEEDCAIYAEQFLDTLEEIASLYRSDMVPRRAADYFENKFSYGRNLWDWYHMKVLNYSKQLTDIFWDMDDKNPIEINENMEKYESEIIKKENFYSFALILLQKIGKRDNAVTCPKCHRLSKKEVENIITYFKGGSEKEDVLKLISPDEDFVNIEKEEDQMRKIKNFVLKYINNERWRDFRNWCKQEGITPFEEDESLGLILPLKMWQLNFEK